LPPIFDAFDYIPVVGASGGSIIIWKSNFFSGTRVFQNVFLSFLEILFQF